VLPLLAIWVCKLVPNTFKLNKST